MKKVYLIIAVTVGVLFLLILMTFILSKKTQRNPVATIFPRLFPTPTTIVVQPKNDFEDYTRQPDKPAGFDDSVLPTNAPINHFNFIQADSYPPVGMTPLPVEKTTGGDKVSPDRNYFAKIDGTNLVILSTKDSSVLQTVNSKQNIKQSNFAWLSNDLLLFIEKEDTDRQIDQMYIVDRSTGKQTYLLGSFAVPKRFNLSVDPVVYNYGQEIFIVDNDNQYWQLSIR